MLLKHRLQNAYEFALYWHLLLIIQTPFNSRIFFYVKTSCEWNRVSFSSISRLEIASHVYIFSQHCHVMGCKLVHALCTLLQPL